MIRCMFLSYPISLATIGVCVFCAVTSVAALFIFRRKKGMGLFDKIKKAIDDSGVVDAAKAAVKSFTESTESKTVETPQKQIVEEKVAEKEVKETKPKAPPKPACEHGECVLCEANGFEKELFCTCDALIECNKKTKYKVGDLWDEELFPILKAYAKAKNIEDRSGYSAASDARMSLANKIIKTYAPDLMTWEFKCYVSKHYQFAPATKDDALLSYLVNLHKRDFKFEKSKIDRYHTVAKILSESNKRALDWSNLEWLYNSNFYDSDKLETITEVFLTFSDKKWLESHLLDASVVDLSQFFNDDATIKKAGWKNGGEDTIYGILLKWCKNNKNEEVFAEEREHERRMKICDACVHRWKCEVVALQEICPAFKPKIN